MLIISLGSTCCLASAAVGDHLEIQRFAPYPIGAESQVGISRSLMQAIIRVQALTVGSRSS